MAYGDSIDKIVYSYFWGVTRTPFFYKGKTYEPKLLIVDRTLFRSFVCPPQCGACCYSHTLDYLPTEDTNYPHYEKRGIELNHKSYTIVSDLQKGSGKGKFCRHLELDTGWCGIHSNNPLSCDFELTRFFHGTEQARLRTQVFSRGWNMTTVLGEKGAKCKEVEFDLKDLIGKLKRLKNWTDYFELKTWLPEILQWVEKGPHNEKLVLNDTENKLEVFPGVFF